MHKEMTAQQRRLGCNLAPPIAALRCALYPASRRFAVPTQALPLYGWFMSMAEIQSTIASWPAEERGRLVAWLLNSLPPHASEDGVTDSIEEAARRGNQLDAGQATALSSDEFWDSIRED
jgi:hypothetical protein